MFRLLSSACPILSCGSLMLYLPTVRHAHGGSLEGVTVGCCNVVLIPWAIPPTPCGDHTTCIGLQSLHSDMMSARVVVCECVMKLGCTVNGSWNGSWDQLLNGETMPVILHVYYGWLESNVGLAGDFCIILLNSHPRAARGSCQESQ